MTRSESRRESGYGGVHDSVVASGKPDWPAIWYAKLRRHGHLETPESGRGAAGVSKAKTMGRVPAFGRGV
ncbi:hypothetical protein Pla52n_33600 [Stieleria varia]|uniref:Uncharacterized protein n=1 Tax=Stieleria varia TaxID=2528005 RepID=A0A5C6ARF4_9BACT|nr:hypothetical protein Pla52n_33600 [Stieleria varia]